MARIALISDIHANLDALEVVLREIDAAHLDKTICLGDVVGYGPDPVACVEALQSRRIVTLLGNHDEAAVTTRPSGDFNPAAMQSMEFTRGALDEPTKAAIRDWPRRLEFAGVAFVHGSFGRRRYDYVTTAETAADALTGLGDQIGAVGHTHIPSVFTSPSDRSRPSDVVGAQLGPGEVYEIPYTMRAIVNPGSVGQPRDRDPRAAFGLLDTQRRLFQVMRIPYDIDAVEAKIKALGLPPYLSDRLRVGA